jgi:hypothetical protein
MFLEYKTLQDLQKQFLVALCPDIGLTVSSSGTL